MCPVCGWQFIRHSTNANQHMTSVSTRKGAAAAASTSRSRTATDSKIDLDRLLKIYDRQYKEAEKQYLETEKRYKGGEYSIWAYLQADKEAWLEAKAQFENLRDRLANC
jgi:hypothetical protein